MNRIEAGAILDAARKVPDMPVSLITQALTASGDIGGKGGPAPAPLGAFAPGSKVFRVVDLTYGLTDREVDILAAFAPGRTYEQVGLVLALSPHTVQDHVKCIYRKMGTNHMTTAVLRAERAGLLQGVEA